MAVMQWGYIRGAGGRPVPHSLSIRTHVHWLIMGSSGSGKTQAVLYLIGCLLQKNPDIHLVVCNFKTQEFSFLRMYPYYYSGNECYEGVKAYYEAFNNDRTTGKTTRRHMLIFDEYPAFISYLATKDKQEKTKKAEEVISAISEILMLGRSIGKHSYGICLCTQRPDANLFANGSRDNFMVICTLGRIRKDAKAMMFSGEDVPDKPYKPGEGVLLADGHPLVEICIPRIRNIVDWKKNIKNVLMKHCEN